MGKYFDIDSGSIEIRDGLKYVKGSSNPYSGKVYKTFENGNRDYHLENNELSVDAITSKIKEFVNA